MGGPQGCKVASSSWSTVKVQRLHISEASDGIVSLEATHSCFLKLEDARFLAEENNHDIFLFKNYFSVDLNLLLNLCKCSTFCQHSHCNNERWVTKSGTSSIHYLYVVCGERSFKTSHLGKQLETDFRQCTTP